MVSYVSNKDLGHKLKDKAKLLLLKVSRDLDNFRRLRSLHNVCSKSVRKPWTARHSIVSGSNFDLSSVRVRSSSPAFGQELVRHMFVLARLRKEGCKKRKWSRGDGKKKRGSGPVRLRRKERRRKKDQLMLSRRVMRSQHQRRKRLRHPLKIPKKSEAMRALF
jgi:hypothetical protein